MHRVSLQSKCSSHRRGRLWKVKKTTAVLKRAMTEKRERWQGKEWYGGTKSRWQQPAAGGEGGQSSHDTWDISRPKGKGREISAEMDAVATAVKEKSTFWNQKSCKESTKREAELFKMVEVAVTDEKQEERERGMIRDLLVELRKSPKGRDEEDERKNLIEEMQRNLHDAQNKSYEVEQKLNRTLWEYIDAFDNERGRPRLIMTKLWQMMQSREAKNLNLDKDLDEILINIKQTGWSESTRTKRFWTQDEEEEQ